MGEYLVEVTHTFVVKAHNKPTAELMAKASTQTIEENKEEGILQVKPFSSLKIKEIV
jgi:hypothetical protein